MMTILLMITFLLIFYIWLWKKLIHAEQVYLESRVCQACDHKNLNEAIFCANCGKKITQKVEKKQGILITIGQCFIRCFYYSSMGTLFLPSSVDTFPRLLLL